MLPTQGTWAKCGPPCPFLWATRAFHIYGCLKINVHLKESGLVKRSGQIQACNSTILLLIKCNVKNVNPVCLLKKDCVLKVIPLHD